MMPNEMKNKSPTNSSIKLKSFDSQFAQSIEKLNCLNAEEELRNESARSRAKAPTATSSTKKSYLDSNSHAAQKLQRVETFKTISNTNKYDLISETKIKEVKYYSRNYAEVINSNDIQSSSKMQTINNENQDKKKMEIMKLCVNLNKYLSPQRNEANKPK